MWQAITERSIDRALAVVDQLVAGSNPAGGKLLLLGRWSQPVPFMDL